MSTRPDLRDIATNVREAFADSERDALLDILTFVVKEYVVEGPPPMLMHQAETIAELSAMSFAQLITALQTRLELPELALFAVDGDQVSVRVGGVMHPLVAGRTPPGAELPRPSAGVRVVESNIAMQRPAPAPAPVGDAPRLAETTRAASPPPPSRGLSVRGRGEAAPMAAPMAAPQAPGPAQQGTPAGAPAPGVVQTVPSTKDGPESGDDASDRFSLLELD